MELLRDRIVGVEGSEVGDLIVRAVDELATRLAEIEEAPAATTLEQAHAELRDLRKRVAWLEAQAEITDELINSRMARFETAAAKILAALDRR